MTYLDHNATTQIASMCRLSLLSFNVMKIHRHGDYSKAECHKKTKNGVYHNFFNKMNRLIIVNSKIHKSAISTMYANAKIFIGMVRFAEIQPVKDTKTTVKTVNSILKTPISSLILSLSIKI